MNLRERDRKAYRLAREYLLSFHTVGLTEVLLEEYISPTVQDLRPDTLESVYQRLLDSAQNRGMGPSVIGRAIGGIDKLERLLVGFEPRAVVQKYGFDWNLVLDDILWSDRDAYRDMARNAHQLIASRFDKQQQSRAFLEFFEGLL
ncbi:hypothetical protein ACFLT5_01765 [Chloroflexota bacterium]